MLSLASGLTTGTAQAVSSGTISLSPASGTVVSLESSRLSSRTALDIKVPASLPFSAGIQLRSATTGAGYRTKVRVAADGALTVSLSRVAGGVETALGSPVNTGLSVKPGESIRLQGAVAGLDPVLTYVRAWKVGTTAPDWQLAARDYTAARIRPPGRPASGATSPTAPRRP